MRFASLLIAIAMTFNASTVNAQAEDQGGPLIDYGTRFIPAIASKGMVSGPEKLASEAGLEMLKRGGNAIDAAVATGFALAVTLPRAGNIGGGGFMLVHLAESNEQVFIDYREMAPGSASRDMFLNEDGAVNKQMAYNSVSAAGIPGTVAGMIHALAKYGSLDLKTVIQPAIDLAEIGFEVPAALHLNLRSASKRLLKNAEANRVYLGGNGIAPALGTVFKQPDLAKTLKRIRDQGSDGFYKGRTAELIVAEMQRHGGLITEADLASYRAIERKQPIDGGLLDHAAQVQPQPAHVHPLDHGTHVERLVPGVRAARVDHLAGKVHVAPLGVAWHLRLAVSRPARLRQALGQGVGLLREAHHPTQRVNEPLTIRIDGVCWVGRAEHRVDERRGLVQQRRLGGARDAQHATTHAPATRVTKRVFRVERRRCVAEQADELGRLDEEVGPRAEEHGQKLREGVVHDALACLA